MNPSSSSGVARLTGASRAAFAALAGVSLLACGETRAPGVPSRDASRPEASVYDTGVDSAVAADSAVQDGATTDGSVAPECQVERLTLNDESLIRHDRVALAGGEEAFVAAWIARVGVFAELVWTRIPSFEGAAEASRNTTMRAIAAGAAVAKTGSGYRLAFHSNAQGDYDVFTLALDANGAPVGEPLRVTSRTGADEQPSVASLGAGALLTWIQRTPTVLSLQGRRLSASGDLEGDAAFEIARNLDAVASSLTDTGEGAIASWVQGTGSTAAPQTQWVPIAGNPHTATPVPTEADANGLSDLAIGPEAGAIAYGVVTEGGSPQVRVRPLDRSGVPSTSSSLPSEVVITATGQTSSAPSITTFGNGFVVAHRARYEDGTTHLEAVYLDALYAVRGRVDAGLVEPEGDVVIRTSLDGRQGVLLRELDGTRTRTFFVRISCSNL